MDHLEDILAAECVRQGINPSPEAFRQMLTEAIGRLDSHHMINLPKGSISIPDFVKCFNSDGSQNDPQSPSGNLTENMKRELAELRSQSLPSNWHEIRKGKIGISAEMMDQVAQTRQGK